MDPGWTTSLLKHFLASVVITGAVNTVLVTSYVKQSSDLFEPLGSCRYSVKAFFSIHFWETAIPVM